MLSNNSHGIHDNLNGKSKAGAAGLKYSRTTSAPLAQGRCKRERRTSCNAEQVYLIGIDASEGGPINRVSASAHIVGGKRLTPSQDLGHANSEPSILVPTGMRSHSTNTYPKASNYENRATQAESAPLALVDCGEDICRL